MNDRAAKYVPKRFVYETTLACNLRCRHCGSSAGTARPDELTTEEAGDLFTQGARIGCERVTFSGGEPMLRPDWLELIRLSKEAGLGSAMITNGLLLDLSSAREAKRAGLSTVGLSVDGIRRTHDLVRGKEGHFDRLMEVIDICKEARLSFTIITTFNRLNVGQADEIFELVKEKKAFSWQVQPIFAMGNMLDNRELQLKGRHLIELEERFAEMKLKREQRIAVCNSFGYCGPHEKIYRPGAGAPGTTRCAAGIRSFGVESNGNVKGCLSIVAGCGENRERYVEGNVRDETLEEIWNRPGAFAYNREWSVKDMSGFCAECAHVEECRGGCRTNMVTSGNGVENEMCVYRAVREEEESSGLRYAAPKAAAALFAALLGASFQSCGDDDSDTSSDADVDGDTDGDSDTDVDAYDADTDTDAYDADTDTDTNTNPDAGLDSGTDSGNP